MKVAIVGSREFKDEALVNAILTKLAANDPDVWIVSGGARGADTLAATACYDHNLKCTVHKADWNGPLGKGAGFARNKLIVEDADMVIALFADGPKSRGTMHTVGLALLAKKPVHAYHEGRWTSR
jgi:predicted Rossmann fold nucleotide-binding protein DprA/Smf involved in DNA uptake